MSAAPAPKPDDPGDAEGWALLEGLRRRLDDQAAQTRKTQAQVGQLAESIAALVETQRRRARWMNLNSFVAYVVFTLLCGGAFYYLYQNRARELVSARDHAVAERDAADKRAGEALAKLAARDAADVKAAPAPSAAPVSAAKLPDPLDATWKAAQASFKAGKFADTYTSLETALAKDPGGSRAPELHYLAGLARGKVNDTDAAIAHLHAAIARDVGEDDAQFQLASIEDRAGKYAQARGDYEHFATSHPQSPYAALATRRAATLARPPSPSPPPSPPASPSPSPPPPADTP